MVLVRPGERSVAYANDIASDEGLRDESLGLVRVRRVLVEQLGLMDDDVSVCGVRASQICLRSSGIRPHDPARPLLHDRVSSTSSFNGW